jgi:hypothetical protein
MRAYHIGAVSFAADADERWVDNLLTRYDLPGVSRGRRGVSRRISQAALRQVVLVRRLAADLGLPLAMAVRVAAKAIEHGTARIGEIAELRVDLAALDREIDARLAASADSVIPRPRGRPSKRTGRR